MSERIPQILHRGYDRVHERFKEDKLIQKINGLTKAIIPTKSHFFMNPLIVRLSDHPKNQNKSIATPFLKVTPNPCKIVNIT